VNTHESCCREAGGGWRTEKGELNGVSASCLPKKAAGTVFGIGSTVGDAKDGDEKRQLCVGFGQRLFGLLRLAEG